MNIPLPIMKGRTDALDFFIPGTPAPGGSKRFVGFGKASGRAILIDAAGERNKNWRAVVALAAKQAVLASSWERASGPLAVTMDFVVTRPKSHYGAKGLKPSAPAYPTTRPDVLKLARSTEDAMTGIVWEDDAATVRLSLAKDYGPMAGCIVTVRRTT